MRKTTQMNLSMLPVEDDLSQLQWLYYYDPCFPDLKSTTPELLKAWAVQLPQGLLPLGEVTREDLAFMDDIMEAKLQLISVMVAMANALRDYLEATGLGSLGSDKRVVE